MFAFNLLKGIALMLVASYVLELLMTGTVTHTPLDFIGDVVVSILQIPGAILDFILCAAFQLIDFVIEVIWDGIPGLSDVFNSPSVSDLFNAC